MCAVPMHVFYINLDVNLIPRLMQAGCIIKNIILEPRGYPREETRLHFVRKQKSPFLFYTCSQFPCVNTSTGFEFRFRRDIK